MTSVPQASFSPVSYTHLDVYKRQGFLRALGRGPGAVLLVAHGGVSIPVQLFARGVQSLGPGGAYVPLIWPHGKVLHFTVPQEVGQKA